ncbi:YggS family pyridoxal phosphate-dependent enzyme [Acetobacterium fimetarium]|uniref:Pyridoxal phosphate homeostasis protein n=1 Tax=Acetobacterium fimetarium TaxID=52691 RepID=A0ABR6WWB4_9FIRM|nr:YggS family pyridoxal phosphate-dependent enzyme [Acetobacterium fimetarium]MBC3804718.1 YggS family pyridoxal phosphate-dependent enzyme [Acetobacterium fimetarium]
MISDNIEKIKSEIPDHVTLVAVTKYHSTEDTKAVLDAGVYDLGESKVQDFLRKYEEIGNGPRWHFIGHLQKNKVKYLIGKTFLIHSVDSIELLNVIEKESEKQDTVTSVLLQLNLAREDTKSGILREDLEAVLKELPKYKYIKVKGLMAIGPLTQNNEEIRNIFVELKKIYDKIKEKFSDEVIQMTYLSMGMTDDYTIAIKEGSNMIRIGRKIFM